MTRKRLSNVLFANAALLIAFAAGLSIFLTVPNPMADLFGTLIATAGVTALAAGIAGWCLRPGSAKPTLRPA